MRKASAMLLACAVLPACGKRDRSEDQPAAAPAGAPAAAAAPAPEERAQRVAGVGTPAPDFTAPAHDGSTVSLSALRGKVVVLYFYPKDETPG